MNLREKIYKRDGGQCVYCGKKIEIGEMHLEHKIPKVFGGTSEETNLLCSCKECNFEKSSKLMVRSEDMLSASDNFRLKEEVVGLRDRLANRERRIDFLQAALDLIIVYAGNGDEEGAKPYYERLGKIMEKNDTTYKQQKESSK